MCFAALHPQNKMKKINEWVDQQMNLTHSMILDRNELQKPRIPPPIEIIGGGFCPPNHKQDALRDLGYLAGERRIDSIFVWKWSRKH